jgi:predicted dehydrogenase
VEQKLRWGILGTGMIAKTVAKALNVSTTGQLVAVASRSRDAADKFGDEFKVPRRYGSYAELLADTGVDVVYISLPNSLHAAWTIRCAEAGKHVLCEKPLTSNHAEAMKVIEACRQHDVFMLEAFMCRCHPHAMKVVELVRSGAIGEVRFIQSSLCFKLGDKPTDIRCQASMSGGSIMDVGCYPMSLSRLIAGAALGLNGPAEPLEVKGTAHMYAAGGVDEWAVASVRFPGDILAGLVASIQFGMWNPTVVYGAKGRMVVQNPWYPGEDEASTRIELHREGANEPEVHFAPGSAGLFTIEVDTVARHIKNRQAPLPAMSWADSLGNMRALDMWRQSVGVVFDCEK